jgi:hypothetical protein
METTERLTWDQVRRLSSQFTASGEGAPSVLSIYLQLPAASRSERRRWQTMLNSGLTELRALHRGDRALDRLAEESANYLLGLPPDVRTAGIIYLAAVDGTRWFQVTQLPLGTTFAWRSRPLLQPLVVALHASPPTGVIVLAQAQARLMTWDQGLLREEAVLTADVDTSDWRRYQAGSVQGGAMTSTSVDDFQARFDAQVEKFVRGLAREVADLDKRHGWQMVMPITPPKLAEPLSAALTPAYRGRILPGGDVNLIRAGNEALADHVAAALAAYTAEKQATEVTEVLRVARSRGAAALGPADCLALLAQFRVEHLYYDGNLRLTGYLRGDGSYSLDPDPSLAGQQKDDNVTEWAMAACLNAGGKVTPVFGPAAELLTDAGGMVATLRY